MKLLSNVPASLSVAALSAVLVWGCSNGDKTVGFEVDGCEGVAMAAEESDRVASMMIFVNCQVAGTDFDVIGAQEMLERQVFLDAINDLNSLEFE